MNGWENPSDQRVTALCEWDEEIARSGQRFKGKLNRLLAGMPVPARNLERRRITHAATLQVRSDFDEASGVHYIHGVRVLQLAKVPRPVAALSTPLDLVALLRDAGDRPADHSDDPDLRAAAEHLRRQTLSYLNEHQHRVAPNVFLGPGWRARVEMEVLNFCNTFTGIVTLVAHVVIEVGPVGVYQDG